MSFQIVYIGPNNWGKDDINKFIAENGKAGLSVILEGDSLAVVQISPLEAPVVTPDPPAARHPVGKGFFIWQPWNTTSGDPVAAAAKAKAAGVNWVALKIHERHVGYPNPAVTSPVVNLAAWVAAFKAQGIKVWGWGYVYGDNPTGEADIVVSRSNELDLEGYLIDAEAEYKDKHSAARLFMGRLRSQYAKPVGLCSFRYPDLHRTLPWAEFLAGCDFHAPQVYPLGNISNTGFGLQIKESLEQLKARADLPFIPIGPACQHPVRVSKGSILTTRFPVIRDYGDGTVDVRWQPTVIQLNDFHNTAKSLGLPGDGWWSWQACEPFPDWWSAISAHAW